MSKVGLSWEQSELTDSQLNLLKDRSKICKVGSWEQIDTSTGMCFEERLQCTKPSDLRGIESFGEDSSVAILMNEMI